jgi:hypothetical protein
VNNISIGLERVITPPVSAETSAGSGTALFKHPVKIPPHNRITKQAANPKIPDIFNFIFTPSANSMFFFEIRLLYKKENYTSRIFYEKTNFSSTCSWYGEPVRRIKTNGKNRQFR